MAKYDPSEDPIFQPKPLIPEAFEYDDLISDQTINDIRSHHIHKAALKAKDAKRKSRLTKSGSGGSNDEEDGENVASNSNDPDIMKKDMTTDHNGKIIAMRVLNGAKLPSMTPAYTKSCVLAKKDVILKDNAKQIQ